MTSAPSVRRSVIFSGDCVSGMTITVRYPLAWPMTVRPMPVLPAVPSMIVSPDRSWPRCSASRMMPRAARSLMEPPGFSHSALPRISQPVSSDNRRSRSNGVRPTCFSMPEYFSALTVNVTFFTRTSGHPVSQRRFYLIFAGSVGTVAGQGYFAAALKRSDASRLS